MRMKFPRLAVRAVIVQDGRLLLVNAYPDGRSDLWCAPGGGVEAGSSLPDNLAREVLEETGLTIGVGDLVGVNEFKAPDDSFHQVDLFFHARILSGTLDPGWTDPERVVSHRRFVAREEFAGLRVKPDMLGDLAWGAKGRVGARYDPLEPIVG